MAKSFSVYEATTGRKLGEVDGAKNLKDAKKRASKKFKNKTVTVR